MQRKVAAFSVGDRVRFRPDYAKRQGSQSHEYARAIGTVKEVSNAAGPHAYAVVVSWGGAVRCRSHVMSSQLAPA